jgi:hypothetical protein
MYMFLVSILNLSWLYRTLKENIFNVLSETTKPIKVHAMIMVILDMGLGYEIFTATINNISTISW